MPTPLTATPGRLQLPQSLSPNALRPITLPKFPIDLAISDAGLETRKLDTIATDAYETAQHFHFELTLIYDYKSEDFTSKFLEFYLGQSIGHWRAFEIPQDHRLWCLASNRRILHKYLHPFWRFQDSQVERSAFKISLLNLKGEDLIGI
jgi:hypothetical protein